MHGDIVMQTSSTSSQRQEIERLERAFWQSIVDGKTEVATAMLSEPALMVAGHGASKFDHAGYTRMAGDDRFRLVDFQLDEMDVIFPTPEVAVATYRASQSVEREGRRVEQQAFDSSTWVRLGKDWKCVAHTESLRDQAAPG
jgi:hypothetical protein